MELIIHTKYAIGQEVYLKKTALDFSRGYFIDVEVPDTTLIELPLLEFMYILIIQVFITVSMENRNLLGRIKYLVL